MQASLKATLACAQAFSSTDFRPDLKAFTMPTLVIHGETDELVPAENGRVLARAIPSASLAMIPGASHIFFTDQFDASLDAILSFLGQRVPV